MRIDAMFSEFRPVVEKVMRECHVSAVTNFTQLIRDELAALTPEFHSAAPTNQQLQQLYELRARYLDWEIGTGYLGYYSPRPGTRYTFTRRLEVMLPLIQQSLPTQNILEIGCGAGLLSLSLAKDAETIVGIDVSESAIAFAKTLQQKLCCANVAFEIGDAEHLQFQDQTFELLLCSEVLEHLIAPELALAEFRRVLKPNGCVILTTPSAVSLSRGSMRLLRLLNRQIQSEKTIQFDKKAYQAAQRANLPETVADDIFLRVHRRFRYAALLRLFHNAGFMVNSVQGAILAFPPHHQIFYRYCPGKLLPAIRCIEHLANALRVFPRFGAVTTCFRLLPIS
ncbi:hypothetical protein U14_00878 [Candidatus Moduliflexus flocculans]|uniref:Methyltransferase domain-containing protein n=1 Tax=Candidatus Moduliflexus flocculans TaxID=1499966 RepID=A0A0S6VR90_9BACT|nr:hypothetical protein U14_00878 [Candidatus Moduliflexus flocculans]